MMDSIDLQQYEPYSLEFVQDYSFQIHPNEFSDSLYMKVYLIDSLSMDYIHPEDIGQFYKRRL